MGHQDHELPFVHGPPPPSIERRTVTVEPHASLAYDSDHWTDALVLLTEGNLQLEDLSGREWHLGRGSVPCLAELPLRRLHNPGLATAALIVVTRRRGATDGVSSCPLSPPGRAAERRGSAERSGGRPG